METHISDIIHVIQLAVAPVFLLSAVGITPLRIRVVILFLAAPRLKIRADKWGG